MAVKPQKGKRADDHQDARHADPQHHAFELRDCTLAVMFHVCYPTASLPILRAVCLDCPLALRHAFGRFLSASPLHTPCHITYIVCTSFPGFFHHAVVPTSLCPYWALSLY